jgi:hypothetical protein
VEFQHPRRSGAIGRWYRPVARLKRVVPSGSSLMSGNTIVQSTRLHTFRGEGREILQLTNFMALMILKF